jgi:hypothetical protein
MTDRCTIQKSGLLLVEIGGQRPLLPLLPVFLFIVAKVKRYFVYRVKGNNNFKIPRSPPPAAANPNSYRTHRSGTIFFTPVRHHRGFLINEVPSLSLLMSPFRERSIIDANASTLFLQKQLAHVTSDLLNDRFF